MSSFVQCPACGGPVHSIASKCKHCKADLLKHKEAAAQQSKATRQTFRGPPPAGKAGKASAARSVTSPPAQPAPQHGPQIVYAQPSAWSRRWPIAVSALAVVAIVASLVILLTGKDEHDDGRLPSRSGNTPHRVPDDMQTPNPGKPHGSITPRVDPDDPFPPAPRGPKPKAWTTAPDPGMFPVALAESVCAKMEDCGLGAGAGISADTCRHLAQGRSSPDVDAKVQSGQCSYDRGAASACLRAIDRLPCSLGSGGSSMDALPELLTKAAGVLDCTTALVCR